MAELTYGTTGERSLRIR